MQSRTTLHSSLGRMRAAPIVPGDKDGRRVPVLALADGVHDGRNPIWSFKAPRIGVVGVSPVRNDPGNLREFIMR